LLYPIKVILALCVQQSKDGVGICFAIDMGNAEIITDYRNARRLFFPGPDFSILFVFSTAQEQGQ
jgi:hypothetical protein